ncbi:MAG TPA: hemolysin family protein [Myxococcota bacterium]|nr:hemolysin family protein [Myxococcota bacterium]
MAQPGLALDALGLVAVLALVLVNAYFVATEFALVAVRRSQIRVWVAEGRRGASSVATAIERLGDAIAACQLGITAASIGLGWLGQPALAHLLRAPLAATGVESVLAVHSVAAALAFAGITFLHVVLGELAPKALALDRPGEVALLFARPLLVFGAVFRWVLVVLRGSGNWLVRLFGVRPPGGAERVHSAEELSLLVSEAREAGEIRADQGRILGRVFRIARTRVRDVMVPRERVFAIDHKTDPEGLLDRLREEGYTRLPVYRDNLDQIVGILHTKDLFHLYAKTRLVVLNDAIRSAIEMRPDTLIGEALRQFRRGRRHMAVVRDPGGPVLGVVTLEDVLEEIVGEIEDEHDEPTPAGSE